MDDFMKVSKHMDQTPCPDECGSIIYVGNKPPAEVVFPNKSGFVNEVVTYTCQAYRV